MAFAGSDDERRCFDDCLFQREVDFGSLTCTYPYVPFCVWLETHHGDFDGVRQGLAEADRVRKLEGEFRQSVIRFDMFVKAIVYGSESETFRRLSGGLTRAQWEREKWHEKMVVEQAPYAVQQAAGEADILYAAFARYAREVFRNQKRILRRRLTTQTQTPSPRLCRRRRRAESGFWKSSSRQ